MTRDYVEEGTRLLLSWRNPGGGWGSALGENSNPWSTSQVVQLLKFLDPLAHERKIIEGVGWLWKNQNLDNGWGIKEKTSDVVGTAFAINVLSTADYRRHQEKLREAVQWLLDKQNKEDGGWAFFPERNISSVYCTALALIALNDLPTDLTDVVTKNVVIPRGKQFLIEAKNKSDGGWGKFKNTPSEGIRTSFAVLALKKIGAESDGFSGVEWLKKYQGGDGGYGDNARTTTEGTAWAMIALLKSGEPPDSPRTQEAIKCLLDLRKPEGGWPDVEGGQPNVWCTQHAMLALDNYRKAVFSIYPIKPPLHKRIKRNVVQGKYSSFFIALLLASNVLLLIVLLDLFPEFTTILKQHHDEITAFGALVTVASAVYVLVANLASHGKK
jgi:squalene cyclase